MPPSLLLLLLLQQRQQHPDMGFSEYAYNYNYTVLVRYSNNVDICRILVILPSHLAPISAAAAFLSED